MPNKFFLLVFSLLVLSGCDQNLKKIYYPNTSSFNEYVIPLAVSDEFLSKFSTEYASYNKHLYDISVRNINISHDAFYKMNVDLITTETYENAKKSYCINNKSPLFRLNKEDIKVTLTYKDKSGQSTFLSFSLNPSSCK
ncbi:hypothetical protein ACTFWT_09335 [Proteus penneri]|uniref:hypothetical protein n=1 Tax=Proteus penneri TaxID=102862 RepID=UPI003F76F503